MSDAYVRLAPDSTGAKVDTTELTVGANTVERQRVHISGSYSAGLAEVFPAGFLRVSDEPRQTFYDPFDSTLDTVTRWLPVVAAGGGVEAVASGALTMGTGTTANGYSLIESRPTFTPVVPGWLGVSFAISFESGTPVANAFRFWGVGTNGPLTATAPLWDAYGFELATDGKLYAVVYSAGVRTAVADLSASQPTDGAGHRYIIYYRTDRTYWYIDSLASPVATGSFNSPSVQSLPVKLLSIAGGTPPLSSGVLTCLGLAVWDTGKNATLLADGISQWVRATIKAGNARATERDTALIVETRPGSKIGITSGQLDTLIDLQRQMVREQRRLSYILASIASLDFSASDPLLLDP